jgi:hypothetical protein
MSAVLGFNLEFMKNNEVLGKKLAVEINLSTASVY